MKSLRNRMLLIFLLLLATIVAVTLFTVQNATYKHSTGQVLNHAKTSASVVRDKINNRANSLADALQTIAQDFNTKRLIFGASEDLDSLIPVLFNHQRRVGSDITWVLDADLKVVGGTGDLSSKSLNMQPEMYREPTIRFAQIGDEFYLVKAAPVKNNENSRDIPFWLLMGIRSERLINEELVELTDMQISLLQQHEQLELIGSTLTPVQQQMLVDLSLVFERGLHTMNLSGQEFLYAAEPIGSLHGEALYQLLATERDKAYISYNTLLGQLVGLLLIAAIMALVAAMLLSGGITKPVSALAEVANKISGGSYVDEIPHSNISEICYLSQAVGDMQENIRKREKEIHQLAYFDELTGLPNRIQFTNELHKYTAVGDKQKLAVLMLDLDRFKEINDTMGHEYGDKLLQEVAKRLQSFTLHEAFHARLGGDEFGIIIRDVDGIKPEFIAENVANLFNQPFTLNQLVIDVDTSIGVAMYPYDAESIEGLMQCADIALYSCKGHHFKHAVYRPELNKHSVQRLNLMYELRSALAEGQLELHYQPKLDMQTDTVNAVECLIRWTHPEHGFIPPDQFIPPAEQTGAIRDVTHWALERAIQQQAEWRQQGHNLTVAVNISAVDLVDMQLPACVSDLLSKYQTEPSGLTLEVTESAIMSDPESALKALNTLRRMGIVISIDDFGTGYSSMAQLKKMPVQELKIDKAFVLELAKNKDDQSMVKTLVYLAKNLGLQTVAEGVEDADSLAFLKEIGCSKAQGFYMSKALPAGKFEQWLESYSAEDKQQGQTA